MHRLLPMAERTSIEDGRELQTFGRTRWTLTLHVARLGPGGSVTVVVEGSPTGLSGSWAELHAFPAQTSIDQPVTARSYATEAGADADFTVPPSTRYLRARITAHAGTYTLELLADARWLDAQVASELKLVSQELRSWSDGLDRTLAEAEALVTEGLGLYGSEGRIPADDRVPGFLDRVRRLVALQAEWTYSRHKLGQSREATALKTMREMPRVHPEVAAALMAAQHGAAGVWRGR